MMTDKLEKWRGYVPDEELETYRKGGFARRIGFGRKAALLNIDTTWMFVDPAYAMCGRDMPQMMADLTRLTEAFRALDLPIYYSRRDDRSHPSYRGLWNEKLGTSGEYQYTSDPRADQWPEAYAPRKQDRVILKNKPSCFFQTPLDTFLRYDEVDTLVICGISTSGCVRHGAVDAFSHNFRPILVDEACGDRSPSAHKANMFDMDMKFCDVESLDYVLAELNARYGRKAAAE
jgi:maleamate amidohydrolase